MSSVLPAQPLPVVPPILFLPLCQSFYPDSFLFSSFFSILRELSSEIAYSLQS
ncbi:hypothetical protein HMPREF1981_02362 [Bacteroides pyogenes F0041]|uniref:Uncharacterized protein n=1 Tax=Bacteroides pyogenes F0041 TaxID=1321819 RepID=U2CJ03_9BACE|nr:hypothetical protein HMPREF1981_02362 [Bacteroides pyogenes F0041]